MRERERNVGREDENQKSEEENEKEREWGNRFLSKTSRVYGFYKGQRKYLITFQKTISTREILKEVAIIAPI